MTEQHGQARQLAARLGLFAVLFQAVLFGWHHHDVTFAGRLLLPIVANPAGSPQLAVDEDGCEICQVLHHLTAAPVDAAATPQPPADATISIEGGTEFAARPRALAFRARASPRA